MTTGSGRYTLEDGMTDARRLGRALRAGRVVLQGTEIDGVLSFTGQTYPHRRLLMDGLGGLYSDGEWLVDQNWLSQGQRKCLQEAMAQLVGP